MEENNKRIAKNTVYLYIRQLVIMGLSLFTTSIVLEKLGASDYGIYSLVAGFVGGFSVLNGILSSASRRFLALYIGKGNQEELKSIFSTALTLHILIGIVIVLALEIGGLWFLNSELNIPVDRMPAARWVFQLSVISVFVGVIQTPFSAVVTAHEKFNIYAIMSIYDVVGKLLVIFLLVYLPGDKLIIYVFLHLLVGLTATMIYNRYSCKNFPECRWSLNWNKSMLKEMLVFSGYGAFGHVITTVNSQGISIILNIFFTTVMNAARGLAQTVNSIIAQFVAGFMVAATPQLVKYYGSGQMEKFVKLIFNVTQYSLFLLAIMLVPVVLEIDYVVGLWLRGNVPAYTCAFIKITIICSIIYRSNTMIEEGLHAINRIKENTLYSVPVYLVSIPLVYLVLKMGMKPTAAYWVANIPPLLSFIINLILLSKFTFFPGWKYFFTIFLKNMGLIALSAVVPIIVQSFMSPGLIRFLIVCSVSVISTIAVLWNFGLNTATRNMVKEQVIGKIVTKFHLSK